MRIVFMGTPDFALESLKALYSSKHEIIAVVTQPDKPRNRGMTVSFSPVKEFAISNNIQVLQPEKVKNNQDFLEKYKALQPDVAVVVAYGKILPKEVLETPKYGSINVHGSLLPKLRGAAPIQWAVINGDKTAGVTTMYMDEGMDTGDMLLKAETEIGEKETAGELYDRLALMGAKLIVETLDRMERNEINREKQKENDATYAPMLTKETGKIDFNKTAKEIDCLIRGVTPFPGAHCILNEKVFKVFSINVLEENGAAGEILASDCKRGLIIGTADNAIELVEIQPQNKKRMTAKQFLVGNKI